MEIETAIEILDRYNEESNMFTDPEICPTDEHKQKIAELMDFHAEQFKPKYFGAHIELPTDDGEYLVDSKYSRVAFFNTGGNFKGCFTVDDENGYSSELLDVNYWMDIPDFP